MSGLARHPAQGISHLCLLKLELETGLRAHLVVLWDLGIQTPVLTIAWPML